MSDALYVKEYAVVLVGGAGCYDTNACLCGPESFSYNFTVKMNTWIIYDCWNQEHKPIMCIMSESSPLF